MKCSDMQVRKVGLSGSHAGQVSGPSKWGDEISGGKFLANLNEGFQRNALLQVISRTCKSA